jgi:hypothetical protein
MSTIGAITKATDQQKHGAQSEVFQRLVNPMGFLSKSAPTTFTASNESRFTAAHASTPVGQKPGAGEMPNRAGDHIGFKKVPSTKAGLTKVDDPMGAHRTAQAAKKYARHPGTGGV